MMRSWDERTRAWVRNSVSRDVPLLDGEEVVAKMAGGHRHDDDFGSVWRPGTLYLTSMRLLVFRRDPGGSAGQHCAMCRTSLWSMSTPSETTSVSGYTSELAAASRHCRRPSLNDSTSCLLSRSVPSTIPKKRPSRGPTCLCCRLRCGITSRAQSPRFGVAAGELWSAPAGSRGRGRWTLARRYGSIWPTSPESEWSQAVRPRVRLGSSLSLRPARWRLRPTTWTAGVNSSPLG